MTEVNGSAAAAAPAPAGRYLNDDRGTIVPLAHPFALNDVEYREVKVRRITGHETKAYGFAVAAFLKAVTSGQGHVAEPSYPGIELPREAFAMLDDDDMAAIEEAADRFFPKRLRPLMEALNGIMAIGTPPDTGANAPAS
ncbi:MAG: phage tail assembly protein [Devosia sp.]